MTRSSCGGLAMALAVALLAGAATSCIEVGHAAEVGCFADPSEPGCPHESVLDAAAAQADQSLNDGDGMPDSGPDGGDAWMPDSGPDGGDAWMPDSGPDGGDAWMPDSGLDGGDAWMPDSGPDGGEG